jgi:hypothetical protein
MPDTNVACCNGVVTNPANWFDVIYFWGREFL